MPWQWGELGLTESHGNRIIKYADAILEGVRSYNHVLHFLPLTLEHRLRPMTVCKLNSVTESVNLRAHLP
jgi:hypothetical protein